MGSRCFAVSEGGAQCRMEAPHDGDHYATAEGYSVRWSPSPCATGPDAIEPADAALAAAEALEARYVRGIRAALAALHAVHSALPEGDVLPRQAADALALAVEAHLVALLGVANG